RRRQTLLHSSSTLAIFEDYAHHPTEITALLNTLRRHAGRLLVVFQPHRYTRTAQFKVELAAALSLAEQVFLLDVYAASELPVAGGHTRDLVAELAKLGHPGKISDFSGSARKLGAALQHELRDGDTLVFVGAGDIDVAAHAFVAAHRAAEGEKDWARFVAAVRARLAATVKLTENELLGPKTTMRVGGPARVYAEPTTEEELQTLLQIAREQGRRVLLLGRGSNLVVPDEGVDGLVISLAHPNWQTFAPQADGRVWVGAGLRLKNLCGLATKAGLQGFEFMEGIPASVGGALRMNAGAMNGWTFDVVDEVQVMTLAGEKRIFQKAELHVGYRHCTELETTVALGAYLRPLGQAEAQVIKQQIETYQKKRQESQPREPSAGCIFKNPPGTSAGKVIDACGLKGARVGDAEVSSVHANFIVNRGQATGAEVLALVRKIRAEVKARCGITLEPEVMLFGQNWKDVL
ncbi:MAG: UDP-N-acetylmuramate dehydrogenase, partial [Candidatus Didemnitutus sp.]|nr:UDP-N-acetylmuramate dehydrogenase [Candidatus Didemnitutus sp.]